MHWVQTIRILGAMFVVLQKGQANGLYREDFCRSLTSFLTSLLYFTKIYTICSCSTLKDVAAPPSSLFHILCFCLVDKCACNVLKLLTGSSHLLKSHYLSLTWVFFYCSDSSLRLCLYALYICCSHKKVLLPYLSLYGIFVCQKKCNSSASFCL